MPAQITLKALGIVSSPNQLAIPEGALSIGSNIVIRRDGIMEQRRGFKLYGTQTASQIKQLFTYKNRILRHFGSTLQFDTEVLNSNDESVFSSFSGTFSETEAGLRIKSIESNGNLYFTTASGIKKISASNASEFSTGSGYVTDAGGVKAINGSARIDLELGNSSGFLPEDSAVAYRFVWGINDANNNLVLGTPSERVVLYNSLLNFLIPDFDRVLGALDDITTTTTTAFIGAGGTVTTTSAANPTIVTTATPHTLTTDDKVFIYGTGVATIDGFTHTVTVLTATTFSIPVLSPGSAGGTWSYSYVGNLALESTASSSDVKNGLIALAGRIDKDILYANDAGTAPLNINTGALTAGGVATIVFSGAGLPEAYFEIGSKIQIDGMTTSPTLTQLNGTWTVSSVTPGAGGSISFNISGTVSAFAAIAVDTTATIVSNEYRNAISTILYNNVTYDLNTTTINNPATNTQLNILQAGLSAIIDRFGDEPITVISSANFDTYLEQLDVTTSSNVILTANIPESINSNYFLQVYRSDIAEASGATILADLTPNDEMQLVYEAFPTTAELAAGSMTILDEVSDEFAGANLYTNPSTGEGILQGNDVPPLSKDINRFKNVLFYANTQTRQRLNLNLLGVTNFKAGNITTVGAGTPSTITTDSAHGLVVGDLIYMNGTGNVAMDTKIHRVLTVPTSVTFTISASGGAGTSGGYWSNSMAAFVDSSSTRQYYFIKGVAQVRTVTFVPAEGAANTLVQAATPATTFKLNSAKNEEKYYVWFSNGTSLAPTVTEISDIADRTEIKVTFLNADTNAQVALKAANKIASIAPSYFNTAVGITPNSHVLTITNTDAGIVDTLTGGISTGITLATSQPGRGENASAMEVLLSTLTSPAQAVDASARSFQNVINKTSTENTYVYYLSGLADVPGKMLVEGRSLSDGQFYIVSNNSSVGDSFDPPITPTHFISTPTGISIASPTVVTTTASHGLVSNDQAVIAFSNSTLLINGLRTVTNLTATTFSVPVAVTVAGNTGVVINSTDAVFSDNENKINRVYYSKLNQPEAVPLINYFDVGSQENAIARIFPLRDSLFIFKENEGLYRISGETSPFNLALFDSTTSLIAPDSVSPLNNQLFCWTDGGIQTVSEAGVDTVSRDIDNIILKLASSTYTNFSTVTWGIGYHSDQAYIVYTNSSQNDTVAMIGYRYNLETGRWTTIDKETTCGIVNSEDDRLYMGSGDLDYIEQERKTFDRTDFADRQWVKTIATNSFFDGGDRIKLNSVTNTSVGDVLAQEQYVTVYNFNSLLAKLDLDAVVAAVPIVSVSTGSSPVVTVKNNTFAPADVNIGTETITISAHGYLNGQKVRFVSSGTLPGGLTANTDVFIIGATVNTFQVSLTLGGAAINLTTTGTGTHTIFRFHNLSAGDYVNLSATTSDPNLDGSHLVISTPTGYTFTITPASPVTTSGTGGMARYDYSESQEMAGGDDIRTKIIALANKLDTDPGTQFKNYFDIIDTKTGAFNAETATNPTVITTTTAHGLKDGRYVTISGSTATPDYDGNYAITFVTAASFSIPVSVSISGVYPPNGSYITLTGDYRDLLACYNAIIANLNLDPGVVFNNYQDIDSITTIESLITAVNTFTNEVSLAPGINFLVGSAIVYNAIESIIQYTPSTMEDPLGWKHMTNFTMMFENKAFTEGTVGFASDLLPEFIEVEFEGDGNGIFGYQNFGSAFFGGGSHGAPFRTYFPRQVMRCRYFLIRFKHKVARESYALLGFTADGSISQSNRAYR